MQPMQGRCCAGFPATAMLCIQVTPESPKVSGDSPLVVVKSLVLAVGAGVVLALPQAGSSHPPSCLAKV